MRLVTPEIVIDPDEPFKNDLLNRQPFAESLTSLVTNVEDNLVISLDAQWGDGKTTFVKMWQACLGNNEIESIYFDAFANDYFDDPFVALVGNITSLLEKVHPKKAKLDELKKKATKVGVQLLSLGARVGIKAATLGVLKDADIDKLKSVAGDIASGTSDLASKVIEEKLNAYKEDVDAMEEFKAKLSELAQEAFNEKHRPLVFIVDELDRCRPSYALELIEKIKHLFFVNHIVFVLVIHTEQLEESIKYVYGPKIEASTYLQKFINIKCKLPKDNKNELDSDYKKYCDVLSGLHELDTGDDPRNLQRLLESLARGMRLSLRDLQRCYTNLVLFYSATPTNRYRNDWIVGLLGILKVKKPGLFEALKRRTISFKELWNELDLDQFVVVEEDSHRISKLKIFLRTFLLSDAEFELLGEESQEQKIWSGTGLRFDLDRTGTLPYHCDQMESFKSPGGN